MGTMNFPAIQSQLLLSIVIVNLVINTGGKHYQLGRASKDQKLVFLRVVLSGRVRILHMYWKSTLIAMFIALPLMVVEGTVIHYFDQSAYLSTAWTKMRSLKAPWRIFINSLKIGRSYFRSFYDFIYGVKESIFNLQKISYSVKYDLHSVTIVPVLFAFMVLCHIVSIDKNLIQWCQMFELIDQVPQSFPIHANVVTGSRKNRSLLLGFQWNKYIDLPMVIIALPSSYETVLEKKKETNDDIKSIY
ncbi:uncharacterized protein BX664DRAFT_314799 [Halteromyces radiatus]|uniref:uncharacterized protein n=1 Tax=Halteromyces radiatus TaxID=101107 RepID=UPI002220B5D0|nr:uncharacterized protein BX664DRAFT_314799 [Halteromyces radiatus]KAI8089609.1 hypothetical protein BX664DRAFT_314799 [Halteromyces radiatus]